MLFARAGEAGQGGVPPASPESPTAPGESTDFPFAFDGPPPPVLPETVARDASGRVTIQALALSEPLRLDGRLDEAVYASVRPISGFIQAEPQAGSPATEPTDAWVLFDKANVYVAFRCWESHPERMVISDMRRDSGNIMQNEQIAFMFDTFYDRRSSVMFVVTAIGGRADVQVTSEQQYSMDWNPVWNVAVGKFDGGWTVEVAIPFKSIRYRPGRVQIWGFNARRINRWKNELSFLTPVPPSRGPMGIAQAALAATVVGLQVPPGSKNLEVKPYATLDLTSDLNVNPRISNELDGDVGVDVKYGVTQNLTADFTYNTDFAQVEADEQQVNLTRFSLFFPEKREFFLENQGTFGFGGVTTIGQTDTPILFYSRRIGLSGGRAVPIQAGGRLTGRVGRFSLGVLNIRTGREPVSQARPTNFSVVRVKRDVLRRSSVGAILTRRAAAGQGGAGTNDAWGLDGTFAFFANLAINAYWARTRTGGLSGEDTSHRAQLDYSGDRYGVQVERLVVGNHFRPEVGFVRRPDMRRHFGLFRFSPRPRSIESVRKFSWTGSMAYIQNGAGRLETRDGDGEFAIEFQNSDRFSVGYSDNYERLVRPFRIAPDVTLPVGTYGFASMRVGFNSGQHRRLAANLTAEHGTFYTGHKTTIGISRGRLRVAPQLSVEPSYSVNRVTLPEGSFTTHLVSSRVIYSPTPWMFTSALLQYNSSSQTLAANVRLRWEYRPGSELFVVYNDERDTLARRFPDLENRAVVVKINHLLRF